MEFRTLSHRFAEEIIRENTELSELFDEITQTIRGIEEEDLIRTFENKGLDGWSADNEDKTWMSLSYAINMLIDQRLTALKWDRQSPIFQGKQYSSVWTLDFSKQVDSKIEPDDESQEPNFRKLGMAVEVAFNHGEAIAWNLMKPVLAAEINHLEKNLNVDSGVGVMIVATNNLKTVGAFDGAVGAFERVSKYLIPMRNQLTVPIIVIGLEAPKTFYIAKQKDPMTKKNTGVVVRL